MPTFIPRSQWNDTGNEAGGYDIGGNLPRIVIHHTPGQLPTTYADARWEMNRILGWHLGQGWADIGYTFVVWDDYVFEGRGWGRSGAHAPGANSSSIGIAFLLDGRVRLPTTKSLLTARWLVQQSIADGWLSADYEVTMHRDWVSTECPSQPVTDYRQKISDFLHGHTDTVDPDTQLPTTPISPPKNGKEQVLVIHKPYVRKAPFSDSGIPGASTVLDFPYLPGGAAILVSPLEPTCPAFNAVLYGPGGRGEVQAVGFAGKTFVVPAPGKISLVFPSAVAAGAIDVFAREVA